MITQVTYIHIKHPFEWVGTTPPAHIPYHLTALRGRPFGSSSTAEQVVTRPRIRSPSFCMYLAGHWYILGLEQKPTYQRTSSSIFSFLFYSTSLTTTQHLHHHKPRSQPVTTPKENEHNNNRRCLRHRPRLNSTLCFPTPLTTTIFFYLRSVPSTTAQTSDPNPRHQLWPRHIPRRLPHRRIPRNLWKSRV